MILDIGNRLHIENPAPDEVRQRLRNLPREAPFLVLSDGDERFIEARPYSGGYRVEWHDGRAAHRRALVSLERAEDLLCAFLSRDEPAVDGGAEWRALRWYNDPYYWLIAAGVISAAILTILFAAEIWHMIR
jgi:hypothetical protein